MSYFQTLIKSRWFWFRFTLIVSFLPIFFRALLWADLKPRIEIFDIKDLLFAGIAINLSNLNLFSGNDELDTKEKLVAFSAGLSILFAFLLGVIFTCQAFNAQTYVLNWFGALAAAGTVYLNYEVNNYVFSTVK